MARAISGLHRESIIKDENTKRGTYERESCRARGRQAGEEHDNKEREGGRVRLSEAYQWGMTCLVSQRHGYFSMHSTVEISGFGVPRDFEVHGCSRHKVLERV